MKKRLAILSSVALGASVLAALRIRRNAAAGTTNESLPTKLSEVNNDAANARLSDAQPGPRIDDMGTDQSEASEILRGIRDAAFESSDEKLAVALGRPTEEIEQWMSGEGTIDGDIVMKARTLAIERGIEITK